MECILKLSTLLLTLAGVLPSHAADAPSDFTPLNIRCSKVIRGDNLLGLFRDCGFGVGTPQANQTTVHCKQAAQACSVWAARRLGPSNETGYPPALAAKLPLALFRGGQVSGAATVRAVGP